MKVIKYIFLLCLCWACRQDEPGFMEKVKSRDIREQNYLSGR